MSCTRSITYTTWSCIRSSRTRPGFVIQTCSDVSLMVTISITASSHHIHCITVCVYDTIMVTISITASSHHIHCITGCVYDKIMVTISITASSHQIPLLTHRIISHFITFVALLFRAQFALAAVQRGGEIVKC